MEYYAPLSYLVPAEEDGMLLRTILQNRLNVSRKLLSRLKLTERGITVNGERKYITVRVQAGDLVEVRMETETSEDILPQAIPLDIIHEDDHVLIVNKPAGMIVHPTHGHYVNTLANAVVYHWQERGEDVRFRPVHRLDQETSGVLAIAKNPYVHQQISDQMQANTVMKEYLALVHGRLDKDSGTIEGPIDRDPAAPHYRIVTPDGYHAVTHYWTEERFRDATLVRLRLETGRTHQIRVHMQHIGHPLIGDKMYGPGAREMAEAALQPENGGSGTALYGAGGPNAEGGAAGCQAESAAERPNAAGQFGLERHALHASKLAFDHPGTRMRVEYKAELPADMREALERLQNGGADGTE
ncbi:RluA family pseudouridine synthase [Paenibacillus contaminans]|uniref:Pseudouridine synthase n=1 Tax=Paenibacillus contaminans TaxID=450362 RepID=A0A329M2T8_9BACL|nr:RluA family pseudouridine synthase [Paenibacillus contaminans]RAV12943.1 RluA family pseudouridine synthase [Paenibacillus contaminans]